MLDVAVWQEVCDLLANPERLRAEYERRLEQPQETAGDEVEAQLGKLRGSLTRLIDGYTEGFIERHEFEPRVARLRERIATLEEQAQQLQTRSALQAELRLIIGRLEDFAAKVQDGLAGADWSTRRELIRTLVRRVEIDQDQVNVVFRVNPDPTSDNPDQEILHHCGRSTQSAAPEYHLTRHGSSAWQPPVPEWDTHADLSRRGALCRRRAPLHPQVDPFRRKEKFRSNTLLGQPTNLKAKARGENRLLVK